MGKIYILSIAIALLRVCPVTAQVDIDHSLQLTGTGTNARISGIKSVTDSLDAASAEVVQSGSMIYATATGTSNNFSITVSPPFSAYQKGMVFNFISNQNVTGAATININTLGAITIKKNYNLDLAANDVKSGQNVSVMYDGTNFQMLSQLANSGGGPTCVSVAPIFLAMTNSGASVNITSNTTAFAEAVNIPCSITVNQISFNVYGVNTAGTINIGVYSEDGQTNLISVTSSNISSTGTMSIAVSSVALAAGNYYIAMVPVGTANLSFGGSYCNICPVVSGKHIYIGTQTVTANTLPATLSPTALNSSFFYDILYQFDN